MNNGHIIEYSQYQYQKPRNFNPLLPDEFEMEVEKEEPVQKKQTKKSKKAK